MSDLMGELRYVRLPLKRSELYMYLFHRKEADLGMRDIRNIAVSSDALLIRKEGGYETFAVSRLTVCVCVVTLLMKIERTCTDVVYHLLASEQV